AKDIAEAVAIHKGAFFSEKDSAGNRIDYMTAVHGALVLVPKGEAQNALRADYQKMVDDGLLFEEAESFEQLIEKCSEIEQAIRTNSRTIRDRKI
ncbi:MAG: nucleotidyl transferase AbiEii/AbiGii toxin family protein, partial [Candidatus Acidiferrales bacterium]